jgi:hypothetical protein
MTNDTNIAYPWYRSVDGDSLEQGDLMSGLEVLVSQGRRLDQPDMLEAELQTLDLVVMTQTCDIEHNKVESLLLCPRWDLWTFVEESRARGENWGTKTRDALRKGNLPGYHLMDEAAQDGIQLGLGVVDFHCVYTAPASYVRQHAAQSGKRLRLCSPYKEHLAQAFARFFMRVGLPADISESKIKTPTGD